ncbi:hypothetical protein ACLB2K_032421 [Fragaria x ananassa]
MSTEEDTVQEKKTISLKTSDDEVFESEENVAMEFGTVKAFFGDDGVSRDMVMPIPNVHSKELTRIIDFCTKHLALKPKADHDEAGKKELRKFYAVYVKEDTTERIMELILAADYLNVNDFLDLLNQSVADRIKNKSVEYVRKFLGLRVILLPRRRRSSGSSMPGLLRGLMKTEW